MNMKKKFLLLPILALAMPACSSSSGGGSSGSASLAANIREQSLPPICMQESIALVELASANIQLSGGAEIGGDVILLGNGSSMFSGNGRIDGTLYIANSSQAKFSGNASANSVSNQDLSAQAQSISNVILNLSNLPSTQVLASIGTGGQVIVGNGGVNVISVTDGIRLAGKDSLILQGAASDIFVLNVAGDISMSGQSNIQVQGGVLAKNVLINNLGAGNAISLSGQGVVTGTVFGAQRGISVSGGGTVVGSLIVAGDVQISGRGQVIQPQAFCSEGGQIVVPQPPTTTTTSTTTSTTMPPSTTTTTTMVAPTTTTTSTTMSTTTTTTLAPSTTTTTLPVINPNWPPECNNNPMLCG